ncbi:hypothetical protein Pelo_9610 [Pelomyxa schiedti]|nr:hypothetical protein Pelo_9610 [Pelomyxa schiedti]
MPRTMDKEGSDNSSSSEDEAQSPIVPRCWLCQHIGDMKTSRTGKVTVSCQCSGHLDNPCSGCSYCEANLKDGCCCEKQVRKPGETNCQNCQKQLCTNCEKCLCRCVEKSDGKTHAWWDWKQRCTLNYEFQAEKKCKETEAKLGQSKRKSPRSSHYSKVRDKKPEVEKALREHLQAVQHTRPSACVNIDSDSDSEGFPMRPSGLSASKRPRTADCGDGPSDCGHNSASSCTSTCSTMKVSPMASEPTCTTSSTTQSWPQKEALIAKIKDFEDFLSFYLHPACKGGVDTEEIPVFMFGILEALQTSISFPRIGVSFQSLAAERIHQFRARTGGDSESWLAPAMISAPTSTCTTTSLSTQPSRTLSPSPSRSLMPASRTSSPSPLQSLRRATRSKSRSTSQAPRSSSHSSTPFLKPSDLNSQPADPSEQPPAQGTQQTQSSAPQGNPVLSDSQLTPEEIQTALDAIQSLLRSEQPCPPPLTTSSSQVPAPVVQHCLTVALPPLNLPYRETVAELAKKGISELDYLHWLQKEGFPQNQQNKL